VDRDPMTSPRRPALRNSALLLIAALAVACAGCSDDDPPATAASTTTGVPPTPESTVSAAEKELRAAEAAYFRAYDLAVSDPGDADRVGRLLNLYVPKGAGQREMRGRMKDLSDRGFAGRRGPAGYQVVEDVVLTAGESRAVVTVCDFDDGVLYDTKHEGPDGKPIVVDDEPVSGRTKDRWVRQDGRWLLEGGDPVEEWKGENRCPEEPDT
jgi:hypothetical protein